MTCGVYRFRCISRGYFYIGSSDNVEKRLRTHLKSLEEGTHHNVFFQRVFDKYGIDDFEYEIQEVKGIKRARAKEQKYLDKYHGHKKFMNIGRHATGGDNITANPNYDAIVRKMARSVRKAMRSLSAEERKEKFGNAGERNGMYGRTHTPEVRKRLSKMFKGIVFGPRGPWSDERRKAFSEMRKELVRHPDFVNAFAGKHHSKKTRKLLSEKAKARVEAGVMPSNTLKVRVGRKTYRSASHAAEKLGCVPATILNRVRSDRFPEYSFVD